MVPFVVFSAAFVVGFGINVMQTIWVTLLIESLSHHFHMQYFQPDIGPVFYVWRVPGGFQGENYVYEGAFFEGL